MSRLQVNTIETNTPGGVLAVRDVNDALTAIRPSAVRGTAANTPPVFQDSAGTEIGTLCRAWVNFNGQGTVAIRAAFNVSSITDNGVGTYAVNFTNPMIDANYSAQVTNDAATNDGGAWAIGWAVGVVSIRTIATGANFDSSQVSVAIFR